MKNKKTYIILASVAVLALVAYFLLAARSMQVSHTAQPK